MKTQKRPPETASKLGEFSVEVSCLLTARYRLVSQSAASHVVFEGDFWGETVVEFLHSLGQEQTLFLAIGTIAIEPDKQLRVNTPDAVGLSPCSSILTTIFELSVLTCPRTNPRAMLDGQRIRFAQCNF